MDFHHLRPSGYAPPRQLSSHGTSLVKGVQSVEKGNRSKGTREKHGKHD